MEEKERLDQITRRIIGAAIEVHKKLGPGLLESAYEVCMAFELRQLGYKIEQQKPLPVVYKDVKLECGYRLDLVVEDAVIVEIKAVQHLAPINDAQLLSYFAPFRNQGWASYQFSRSSIKEWPTKDCE